MKQVDKAFITHLKYILYFQIIYEDKIKQQYISIFWEKETVAGDKKMFMQKTYNLHCRFSEINKNICYKVSSLFDNFKK